jgi:hypothetical protein
VFEFVSSDSFFDIKDDFIDNSVFSEFKEDYDVFIENFREVIRMSNSHFLKKFKNITNHIFL